VSALQLRDRASHLGKVSAQGVRAFYSRPIGWFALLVTSVFLAYGGGGVMFWFHAIYRGEAGPPINPWYHWLFDSTLGFIALTPALLLIMPMSLAALKRAGVRSTQVRAAAYVLLVGVLFGVATGPGPFLHDRIVGRGEPLGRLAVRIFGNNPAVAASNLHVHQHSVLTEGLLQILVGVPVYIFVGLLALAVVRFVAARRRRAWDGGGVSLPPLTRREGVRLPSGRPGRP
jgi:hypothetical protein